jgi:hypothetical protein
MSNELRRLPVKVSQQEYIAKSAELGRKLTEKTNLEDDLASVSAAMKKKVKDIDKEIAELGSIVNTWIEHRDVECVEVRDEDRMVMHVIRLDTHEVVGTRVMNDSERQLVMFPTTHLRVVEDKVVETGVPEDLVPQHIENTEMPVEKVSGDTTTMPAEVAGE